MVDDKGEVIPLDLIRPELPLTVEYVMDGEKMVAKKVVITRSMVAGDANKKPSEQRGELAAAKAKEAAKEAESPGTVSETLIGTVSTLEQTISLVPRGETGAVSCIINNSTRFVNTAGEPVSSSLMRSGMPITVKTVRDGKRVLVQEVVVRGNPATISTEGTGPRTTGPTGSRPGGDKIQSTPGVSPPKPSAR